MKAERWQQVDKLLDAALELPTAERAAFLASACGPDHALRKEVDSLLEAYARAGNFIESPALEEAAKIVAESGSHRAPGSFIGPYQIISLLGTGGMGEVYLVRDSRLERKLALKLLAPNLTRDEEKVLRFQQEARTASALNHPNIITIYEIGQIDDAHFIATELIEGETLRERMTRMPVQPHEAINYTQQVASALLVAHQGGIIHRDIKPENIMLRPDGYVKLLDFGIAKLLDSRLSSMSLEGLPQSPVRTTPGMILGTVSYMSPEQARGLETDARTDVWSLGVVLYEILTGTPPFRGETSTDILSLILHKEPPPLPPQLLQRWPALEPLLAKALAKDRAERYLTAADMLADLSGLKQRSESAHGLQPLLVEQRRQVTVLFADVAGIDELSETLDAEEAGELLKELWQRIDLLIAEHGGTVEKHMGDSVMALWGLRSAREDDPERAIQAALAMQQAVAQFIEDEQREGLKLACGMEASASAPTQPCMRIGISTGQVFLGAVNSTGEMAVTGAAVNLASRLEQSAPIGSILISRDTYRHVRGIFDVRTLEMKNLQAQGKLLEVYVVARAKPRAFRLGTRGVEGVETRMIGREAELGQLLKALGNVLEEKELCAVTVVADAGLGKSRLLYELSNKVELLPESIRVFNGRARESMRGLPFSLLRDVLSFRFEIQDGDAPSVAREKLERGLSGSVRDAAEAERRAHFIGHLIGFDFSESPHLRDILHDAREIRDRAFLYAAQYFTSISREAPSVLYLEDIHWADDGSLDFVDYLIRACGSAPVFILCLARPTLFERRPAWGEGHTAHTRLNLQPLSKRETRQLLEEILRRAENIPLALREMVAAQAEGNPFYVEEIIKMLIDQQVIVAGEDAWLVEVSRLARARVPPTLTGVLQARLDELTDYEKLILQRASVLGRVFWASAIDRLGAGPLAHAEGHAADLGEALENLRRKEFISRREASAFTGTTEYIFRHALLRDVTYESVLMKERRALHYAAAEWLAGRRGERADEYAAAIAEHFEKAEEAEAAAHWFGRAARQARQAYAPQTAISYYRKALQLLAASGDSESARSEQRTQQLEWYEELGELLIVQAGFADALEAYGLMRAMAEDERNLLAQARAWNGIAILHERLGENRALLESARRAAELAEQAGETAPAKLALARALNMQGHACYRLGDAAALLPYGQQALRLCAELGEEARREQAYSLKIIGAVHQTLGNFAESFHYTERALALYRELGNRREEGYTLNNLGETARLCEDYDFAISCYQEALEIYRETGERVQQMMALSNIGAARVGQKQHVSAEAALQEVIRMAGSQGYYGLSETHRYLAEALLAQEQIEESLESARQALFLGQEKDCQEHIGAAWRVLGMIAAATASQPSINGERHDAESCFTQSLRIFTHIGMEAERAHTLFKWARFEGMNDHRERAAAMSREAQEIFARLGIKSASKWEPKA